MHVPAAIAPDSLSRYMEEVAAYPLVTADEEKLLARQYRRANDRKAAERLITANLRFDHKNVKMTVKEKRVDTGHRKLGTVMGDDCQTGVNVSLHPGVKVGAGAWIAPGVTVDKDVPEGILLTPEGPREKPKTN